MKNEILRRQCRLSTINLSEKDREQIKAAYNSGITNAIMDNKKIDNIVFRDTASIYPYVGEECDI